MGTIPQLDKKFCLFLLSALCLVLGVVFAVLVGLISDDSAWEGFPVPDNYMQVKASPEVSLGIGLYVAGFAAILAIASLAIAWFQACIMCSHVEQVRYEMLNAPLTADELDGSGPGQVYKFAAPNTGFRYDGYSKPGKEIEVDF